MTLARLKLYAELMRIDKPIGTMLLLWPTLWALWIATEGRPPLSIFIIFILGTFLMRSAGCVVNDCADRHFDAHVIRTQHRPLACGALPVSQAIGLSLVLFLSALSLIQTLNPLTQKLSIVAALITASYPYTKRFFPLPQAYLGLAFSFGIPMAFAATTNELPPITWLMMLATSFWVVAYDTLYALVDKEDDLKLGIKTSAITFGRYDIIAILLCDALFLALMTYAGILLFMQIFYYISLAVSLCFILMQYRNVRKRDRDRCFKAFLDNNRVGATIFTGILIDYCWR